MTSEGAHLAAPALSRTSYWLEVAAGEAGFFADLIHRCAGIFAGPVFSPHLTVYSGPADPGADLPSILAAAVPPGGELALRCTGLEFSDDYTRACVLGFAPDSRLTGIGAALRSLSGHSEYRLCPHLSLFYGRLTGSDQQRLRAMIVPPARVRFSGLTAMATPAGIKSREDVGSWQWLAGLNFD